ncbi:DUF2514 family protein [Pseudomonas sp. RIT-PI-a]|uniref:DUF2514 family protein n=1 Tax=Pseudomonas sp. RIT-PI-a TaxID=1681194 RepID=UPI000676919D|nr:DUF2514 family protein [Pseudomonas sp. RIT-PI-a]KNC16577.1 hypothetical protein AC788_03305 [Pseudomonas sp. RIT-PI-a]
MSGVAQVRLVIVLGLGATALYGAYRHGVTVTHAARDAQWAQAVAAQQVEQVRAVQAARDDEQRFQREANQVGIDARKEIAAANSDAVGIDASADRLRIQAGKLAANAGTCASTAGAADRGPSAARAALVLSQLLERADARAGDLAKAYDRARIAGQACERAYDVISGQRGGRAHDGAAAHADE